VKFGLADIFYAHQKNGFTNFILEQFTSKKHVD